MGSRKKLVLASLVSLMMTLAFIIGLMPLQASQRANAASSGGRIDMVDLLNAVLNYQGGQPAESIAVVEPDADVLVAQGSAQAIINVQAQAVGDASPVAFAVDPDLARGESLDLTLLGAGPAYALNPPYDAAIDVTALVDTTIEGALTTMAVYAFANATLDQENASLLNYSVRSDETTYFVEVVGGDEDQNGIPAPLSNIVEPGQTFFASYQSETGGVLNVTVTNLGGGAVPVKQLPGPGVTVSPTPDIFVTSPTYQMLLDAGLVNANEEVFFIANAATELAMAISEVYESDMTTAEWATALSALEPPAGRVLTTDEELVPYVEIALLAVNTTADIYTDTFREVELLPEDLPVILEYRNLIVPTDAPIQLWRFPTWLRETERGSEDYFFVAPEPIPASDPDENTLEWNLVDQRDEELEGQTDSTYIAELTRLSVFGAFQAAMSIYEVFPASVDINETVDVAVIGDFDVEPGEALDNFDVFFGEQAADIISTTAQLYGDGLVYFLVEAPVSAVPGAVDVTVVDNSVPANVALSENGFRYLGIYELTLDVDPEGAGTASVEPEQPTYAEGETVTLTATANALYEFVQWEGDVAGIADVNSSTAQLTFGGTDLDLQITAQFQYTAPIDQYTLTTEVNPEGAGTVTRDPDAAAYAPATVVTLTAVPDTGYEFTGWDGPVADPTSATTTVTMQGNVANIVVTANFEPLYYTLNVIESPDLGGDVLVNPAQAQYQPGTQVTLTAVPADGFNFTSFITPDGVFTEETITITMTGPLRDITVTAVFSQNPILTLQETEGGVVQFSPQGLSEREVNGNTLVEYAAGTTVTVTAVPDPDFRFVRWEGDLTSSNATETFDILEDTTLRAIFTSTNFYVDDITPDSAWFFGGVKARITGTGFMQSTQVVVFGTPVTPFVITPTEIWFNVPAMPVAPTGDQLAVDVIVRNPPYEIEFSETINFTYKRYETVGDVTTTAFRFDAADAGADVVVALEDTLADARLVLPVPEQNYDLAYGLIRATKNASAIYADQIFAGPGTSPLDKAWDLAVPAFDTAEFKANGNTPVLGAWNFAIHLYDPDDMSTDANTANVGSAVYGEIFDWTYPRSATSNPARLTFETEDTTLTADDIRTNITMWSIETAYEYGLDLTDLIGTDSTYQSTLTQLEVTPNVTETAPAADTAITRVTARLYDLTAFALREDLAGLPAEILEGIAIDSATGTATGRTTGGTEFTIEAPNGGLAWVTVGFGQDITSTTPASATVLGDVIDNGASEFSVIVESPAWTPTNENATVDVAIYLNGNLSEPVVVLDNAFQYTAAGRPPLQDIILLLLGLGAAILGLAAGGDSGGGGGGPCFIATAAYGTPMAADIDTLRALRDTYLLESSVGTAFVDAYYRVSPAVASVVAQSPVLSAMVRLLLMPVIFASKCLLAMPAVSLMTVALVAVLARLRRRGKANA